MSKKTKKRNKRYQGEDAKQAGSTSSEPVVHRFEAVEKSKLQEWWEPRKRLARFGAIATGIVGGGALLLLGLFQVVL